MFVLVVQRQIKRLRLPATTSQERRTAYYQQTHRAWLGDGVENTWAAALVHGPTDKIVAINVIYHCIPPSGVVQAGPRCTVVEKAVCGRSNLMLTDKITAIDAI